MTRGPRTRSAGLRGGRPRGDHPGRGPLLAALALAAMAGCGEGRSLPDPGTEAYRRAVATFHVGLASAQVGLDRRAEEAWLETVDAAPGEPAAWADLAAMALRRNEPALAGERMERALALAPESAEIRYAAGVLESRIGAWDDAREHLEAAVAADPGHLPALHALSVLSESSRTRVRGEGPDASLHWTERILDAAPENLAARVDRLRGLVARGDTAAAERALAGLAEDAADWPPEARERLAELRTSLGSVSASETAADVAMLANVLQRVPEYREARRALEPPGDAAGVLLGRFVRLPRPDGGPAPPDTALAFRADPVPHVEGDAGPPGATLTRAIAFDDESPPALLVATSTRVRLPDGTVLPFPGGSGGDPPTIAGVLAADLDNDYRMELVFAGAGGARIFAADEAGGWADVTAARGVPAGVAAGRFSGAWAVDLDLDGDLDLVLGAPDGPPVVLTAGPDGRFAVAAEPAFEVDGLRDLAWGDLDGDGDPDLATVDGDGKVAILRNRGAGRYDPWTPPGAAEPEAALAVTLAELDGNADLDLVALGEDGRILRLGTPASPGVEGVLVDPAFASEAAATGPPGSAYLAALDVDNNGCVDLVASTGGRSGAWLCGGDGWDGVRGPAVEVEGSVTDAADVDGDGRIDLVGVVHARPAVHRNRGERDYGWVRLRPRAAERAGDQRVNAFGLGGEVEVRAGLLYRKLPIDGPVVHAGLGERTGADLARTVWPNGLVQVEFDLEATATVAIRQRLMGSCPWLFVFDGEGMRFVTDVVWPSPLGARLTADRTAPIVTTEDRTLIPGGTIAVRDGAYDVRITSELWETFFIDAVSLIAVDHPDKTIVRVDERFAFRPLDLSARAYEPERPVVRADDGEGTDVTDLVRERDGRTLRPPVGPLQGLSPRHAVEIDLGADAAGRKGLVLLATGWVAPMESAGRIALSQGTGPPPRDLALEVPDGRGGWTVAREGLGMPAGKDKTIVIPLDGLLPTGVRPRVRLTSELAIWWDAFAWTVALPEAPLERRETALAGAELGFRGFSVRRVDTPTEVPVYDRIESTRPRWRDLEGYYTRFGDVAELLAGVDDRYVILNAGDEIRLRFEPPPPPPPGWTRDFVLVTDGWGRNGDYGTEFSTTVLPLPSHDRALYPERPERLEDDPVYRRHADDWRRFHTRYVTPEPFRRALVPE